MSYYNLQIIYNFTVKNKKEEDKVLAAWEEAGKDLGFIPFFEVKEIKRQTAEQALVDADLCGRIAKGDPDSI